MLPSPAARQFKSFILIAPRDVDTLPVVRALHGGEFAVLERLPDEHTYHLAMSGEFALAGLIVRADDEAALASISLLAGRDTPLIAILLETDATTVSACLENGADACLDIGADPMVIVAQANAVLRRGGAFGSDTSGALGMLYVGDITVDIDRCEVERAGEYVPLTASEYRIVEHMARNAGRVLRPHEILNAVSDGYVYLPREAQDVFKVYVRRIRKKLERCEVEPQYLLTVRGIGYRLEGGQEPALRRQGTIRTA
ncbi:MAG: response regulator transcription factor [Dehalococcoidia bacterium]